MSNSFDRLISLIVMTPPASLYLKYSARQLGSRSRAETSYPCACPNKVTFKSRAISNHRTDECKYSPRITRTPKSRRNCLMVLFSHIADAWPLLWRSPSIEGERSMGRIELRSRKG